MNKNKLKILAVSDTHGDPKLSKKLAEKAERENVDLVLLCGDITGWVETKDIIQPFKDKNKEVLLVHGNWDSPDTTYFLSSLYKIKNIHGYCFVKNKIGFFGAGGAINSPGPGRITEEELFSELEKAHSKLAGVEKKVMMTHMHPAGSRSEFSGVRGSDSIRKAIKKFNPFLLLHGHIHEAGGIEETIYSTRVINVGREGKIIEI